MKARFQIAVEARRASSAASALVTSVSPDQTSLLTISFSGSGWVTEFEVRSVVEVIDTVYE